jgi:hypothetical protein
MISLATDIKTKKMVSLDVSRSRSIFIAGKRGSGKSYTLGKIIEDVHAAGRHLLVVVDPLSVFWTTAIPVNGAQPVPVRVLVPGEPEAVLGVMAAAMSGYGIEVQRLWLNPSDLSADAWLSLFGYTLADPQGIVLSRALRGLAGPFTLADLITQVQQDERAAERTVEAVINRLDAAIGWGVFADENIPLVSMLRPGAVNVLDVSGLEPGPQSLRNLAVQLLVDQLYRARLESRRLEQIGRAPTIPPVFLGVDEAHNFCPTTGDALGKSSLIRYVKEGRAADMSLAVATQQPSALDFDLISQCDTLVIHRLTASDDVRVASRLSSSYAAAIPAYLKGCTQPGRAVIVDDLEERVAVGQVLPRAMCHGAESLPVLSLPAAFVLAFEGVNGQATTSNVLRVQSASAG